MKTKNVIFIFCILFALVFINIAAKAQEYKKMIKPDSGSYELMEKRTLKSKTFQNIDGTKTLYVFTRNIHHLNEKNELVDDTTDNNINKNGSNYGIYYNSTNSTYAWDYGTYIGDANSFIFHHWIYRQFIKWGITTNDIPYGSVVNSSQITFGWYPAGNQIFWTLHQMDHDNLSDPQTLWNECGSGYQYGNMNNQGSNVFTNTSSFNNLIITRIESYTNWIGVGLKNDNESDQYYCLRFNSNFQLSITYTPCGIALSPSSWSAPWAGGTLNNVSVTNSSGGHSISWSITVNQNWISTNVQGGTGTPGSFNITVLPNTGPTRIGTITVQPPPGGNPATFTVTQGCSSDITISNQTINNTQTFVASNTIQTLNNVTVGSQGNLTFRVGTSSNCSIVLNPGFITSEGAIFHAYTQSNPCSEPENDAMTELFKNQKIQSKILNSGDNINNEQVFQPNNFLLFQNYPNPFNPSTDIKYYLKDNCDVKLIIYDILGKVVSILVNEHQNAGFKTVHWEASYLSTGIYFCKLIAGEFITVKKMLLLK